MARQPIVFTNDRVRVQQQIRTLANRFKADGGQTAIALQRLLLGFPSIRVAPYERSRPGAVEYALSVLKAAYRALPWEDVDPFLESASLPLFEERLWASRYLSGYD